MPLLLPVTTSVLRQLPVQCAVVLPAFLAVFPPGGLFITIFAYGGQASSCETGHSHKHPYETNGNFFHVQLLLAGK
jgi:hypothetical protein